jgi:hypothetical protein
MTKIEFAGVKPGDEILHKHFGKCSIKEFLYNHTCEGLFGILIQPLTDEGKLLLQYYSGTPIGTPMLEHSLYQFRPINRPFKEENKLLVQFREWLEKEKP